MKRLLAPLLVCCASQAYSQDYTVLPCDPDQTEHAASALELARTVLERSIEALDDPSFEESQEAITWFAPPTEDHLSDISAVYESALTWADSVVFLCVAASGPDGPVYAFVSPDDLFVIHLGSLFFEADIEGIDSRSGTLVHELTHFQIVGATNENSEETYGWENAKSLALSDPEAARENAENYQYFAEAIMWPNLKP